MSVDLFGNTQIEESKEPKKEFPKIIYEFLSSFYPGNLELTVKLFHEALDKWPAEMLLPLLTKQLRDLYWVKLSPSNIPYPSWRVEKLEKQSGYFVEEQLKLLIAKLANIDILAKSSNNNLVTLLDLFIFSRLQ